MNPKIDEGRVLATDIQHTDMAGERTYRAMRADIIFGRLAPAQKIRLELARRQYDVSISTLRETLNRLASEGLVVAEGQRGFEVAPVSPDGFREVAALRLLLECDALEKSLARGDIEWEAAVVGAHHKLAAAEARMASGDRTMSETWKRYDRDFHRALIAACGSEVLLGTHAEIFDQFLRYQIVAVIYRGEIAAEEHRVLLDCSAAPRREPGARHAGAACRGLRGLRPGRTRRGADLGTRSAPTEPTTRRAAE